MKYALAKKIADRVVEVLTPCCEVIHIAGSVRRQKPEVKDIEVCCIPKKEFIKTDLFGGGNNVIVPGFTDAVNLLAKEIIKGAAHGRYMQLVLRGATEIKLDLFMPQPHDYYRQYVIRTGSADYSAKIIAQAWKNKGWCGTSEGLRRISDCFEKTYGSGANLSRVWQIVNSTGEKPPVWNSEEEFFKWLGIPWFDPQYREIKDTSFARELYK